MKGITKLFAAFAVALAIIAPAHAGSCSATTPALGQAYATSVNHNGMWWNPARNGIGVDIQRQVCKIFAAWFFYDAFGNPTFLTFGGDLQKDPQGHDFYTGPLVQTLQAPSSLAAYNPATLKVVENYGTVTFTFTGTRTARIDFSFPGNTCSMELEPLNFGCFAPLVWNNAVGACIAPMGVKVGNVGQLPVGCTSWKQQCWKDAVANGTVKFIATSAKMTGYNDRPVMKAYFRNTSTQFGVTGLWNALEFYADDGSPIGADISGGGSSEVDWVYGTAKGHIAHEKQTDLCYEIAWNAAEKAWDVNGTGVGTPVRCPNTIPLI